MRIDDNLNSVGKKLREMIQYAKNLLKENKIMINKRKVEVIFLVLFAAAILPEFQAVQSLNERYRTVFCIVQNKLDDFEHALTPKIDEYPELFKKKDKDENTGTDVQEIYLQLNEKGENGANIRVGPSLDDESITVINTDNSILYLGEKQYDGTRYWLKVQIDDGEIIGWLSGNLVEIK